MISKANRFHGHNSLSLVYRKGQTVSLNQVSLKYLPIRPDKPYRLAVVVSRKVDKSAVVRNRIRRRVYESMRLKYPSFKQNVDIVISVHNKQLADMKPAELDEIISQLLIKAALIDQ
ncbi:MAG TPA: ribonuclease P protein component [Candidatus Saccharimonadales bacterium]|jgi:ribonuclease P protein component